MRKDILAIPILLFTLCGCTAVHQLPANIEPEIEKALGLDVMIPHNDRFPITFVEIRFPPELKGAGNNDRYVATIAYAKEKGEPVTITAEQKKQLEIQGRRKFLYGEYQGERVIQCEISNTHTSMANAKTKEVNGVPVEYSLIERDKRQFLFVVFNWEKGSYSFNFSLSNSFSKNDGFAFVEQVIKALAANGQAK